jgi:hypothetical protein
MADSLLQQTVLHARLTAELVSMFLNHRGEGSAGIQSYLLSILVTPCSTTRLLVERDLARYYRSVCRISVSGGRSG